MGISVCLTQIHSKPCNGGHLISQVCATRGQNI